MIFWIFCRVSLFIIIILAIRPIVRHGNILTIGVISKREVTPVTPSLFFSNGSNPSSQNQVGIIIQEKVMVVRILTIGIRLSRSKNSATTTIAEAIIGSIFFFLGICSSVAIYFCDSFKSCLAFLMANSWDGSEVMIWFSV